jgi:hypothetical protein
MKTLMIFLNLLALLSLPLVYYTAFEFTEVSIRNKLLKAEESEAFDEIKLNLLLAETMERTGYKKTNAAFAAWLTMDRPWQGILLVPTVAILLLNSVALYFAGRKKQNNHQ